MNTINKTRVEYSNQLLINVYTNTYTKNPSSSSLFLQFLTHKPYANIYIAKPHAQSVTNQENPRKLAANNGVQEPFFLLLATLFDSKFMVSDIPSLFFIIFLLLFERYGF